MQEFKPLSEELRQKLISELKWQYNYCPAMKDIIIVVRNQFEEVRNCLDSIQEHTSDYRLHVWDNGSIPLISNLLKSYNPHTYIRTEENLGFVLPNNYLASLTECPYLILLNSDTIVSKGWDEALIGLLQAKKDIGIVGYQGGKLDENYKGNPTNDFEVDYVCGWCLCLPQELYRKFGLFDPNILIAYGEDSDLCLHFRQNGYKVYALHLDYVTHIGNSTVKTVNREIDLVATFTANHNYIKNKYSLIE